ncbi:MAG TPA: oxidoreductase-like domain-containing protein [Dyella sp.]|uniref:oxidoreductase-like domain-containing protein n=1 Tax=Dyella sp. TaxID=1869338 RepID=UPI002C6774D9|nr:oxidoreductase-like domain-containing protein [Dyella sp.]HTV84193.1 oxidoreductase-like domain-containing protein [Dyella sp.]
MNEPTTSPAHDACSDDPPPRPPVEPDPDDCCGNGCDPCIFDFYEEARQHYREALAAWRERHPGVDPALPASTPEESAQRAP